MNTPMPRFEHIRHKPPHTLQRPRDIVLVSAPLRSKVNLSRMVRLAGCSGIQKIFHCSPSKIDPDIARDAIKAVELVFPRTLPPLLQRLASEGYQCVGLEQTTNSTCLYEFQFPRHTALVIGSEREGLNQEVLDRLHAVVEIPVYGPPASFNVVTATTMAVYEYCKQYPAG